MCIRDSSLYLKDDDYRLSFLYGSYLTLTNLGEADWQRIEEQRLSPLFVSVHAGSRAAFTAAGESESCPGHGPARLV